jgi:hypothetical protein
MPANHKPTDYVLFIHGVNVRNEEVYRRDVKQMFENISATISNPSRDLKPVILYWGNVGKDSTNSLLSELQTASTWKKFWFKKLRTNEFLPFVGDAAIYLSRFVSSTIVRQITDQAIKQTGISPDEMKDPPEGDRLHLVTHSWGTVVLFDILFASRWENLSVSEETRQLIEKIRRGFFGAGTGEEEKSYGIPLASIHTMGSPIALFNLININGSNSFDLSPKFKEFLEALQKKMKKPLVWRNYAHPGDPIAYPLEGVIPILLGGGRECVDVQDIMSPSSWIEGLFGQSILPVINGGKAHGSYWTEPKVAQMIGEIIQSTQ